MEIDKILNELEIIKKEIQVAKTEKSECEGALREQEKTLKSFGVKSIVEGKKKLATLETQIAKLEKKIKSDFGALKENYEW